MHCRGRSGGVANAVMKVQSGDSANHRGTRENETNDKMVAPMTHEENPKKTIDTIVQSFIKAIINRPKEYIFLPCAGWPEWPTAKQASD